MTEKDYQEFATVFNSIWEILPSVIVDDDQKQEFVASKQEKWLTARDCVADAIESDNPDFDRNRFFEACEGGESKMKKYSHEFVIEQDRYWVWEKEHDQFVLEIQTGVDKEGPVAVATYKKIGTFSNPTKALDEARRRSEVSWRR